MVIRRRHFKHTKTFQERLAEEARQFQEAAEKLPPGKAQELLLRRARQAAAAARIDEWLTSPGLRPPAAMANLLADEKK